MNTIDIQHGTPSGFDVLVDGDHYGRYPAKPEAIKAAREAAGDAPRYDVVRIRDFTAMGEGRTTAGVPFAIVPSREPQA